MGQEELLLECWRGLSPTEQAQVLQFTQVLRSQHQLDAVDRDLGAPEPLKIRSLEHLNELLGEGLDELDRGEGIAATDEWWEAERTRLMARSSSSSE